MAITLKRQLNEDEKQQIVKVHGRKCFATGHPIPDGEVMHFDHIRAFAEGGVTELDNIAPMCEMHNKAKGALPLEDFRVKLRLNDFFSHGDSVTLKHLLAFLKKAGDITSYGQNVAVNEMDGKVRLDSSDGTFTHALYTCPATGWKYFYATLPIALLDSDDDEDQKIGLQPRFLISEKVFELYRHFQRHPVLQPSVGRVNQSRILLFDGQHKIAALLWTGRREFECKIYLAPDIKLLNETNIAAHDKFSQTRFYASVMVLKLGTEFGTDFERYKTQEDGSPKSEAGFMKFLDRDPSQALTKAERNRRFRSYLYNSILHPKDNRAAHFVSTGNRGTDEKPLTMDMISKSLFACFLYTEPVEDNMATDAYKRDAEIENNIALMNMLYDLALFGWNPPAGPNDGNQRRLVRLFRSKAIMAWSELVRDAVCGKLELVDAEDRARPFYRSLNVEDLARIRKVIERLANWKLWAAPPGDDIDRVLADNKSAVKDWLKSHGLSTGYLMGAAE
jgi:hypothetical protein